jgi:hypothetical protein
VSIGPGFGGGGGFDLPLDAVVGGPPTGTFGTPVVDVLLRGVVVVVERGAVVVVVWIGGARVVVVVVGTIVSDGMPPAAWTEGEAAVPADGAEADAHASAGPVRVPESATAHTSAAKRHTGRTRMLNV